MATQDGTLLPSGLDADISLTGSGVITRDDNDDLVEFTPQQLINVDLNALRTSYNLGALAGGENSITVFRKAVSAIANNVATTALTITIPDAAHSALVKVDYLAWLGAGGAIGAHEAVAAALSMYRITRVAGVNAVGTAVVVSATAGTAVAGGATITFTAGTLSAVIGAIGAENSFTVSVTIARGSGASDNHEVLMRVEVINAEGTGITVV